MSNKKPFFFFSHFLQSTRDQIDHMSDCHAPPPLKVKEWFLITSTYVSSLEETLKSK